MRRTASPKAKFSIFSLVRPGIIIALGIGCVCFAMIKILSSSVQPANFDSSSTLIPTASGMDQFALMADKSDPTETDDPSNTPSADKNLYPVYPMQGDTIGNLSFPTLALKLPIIQGTGTNDLEEGVGHFIQSVLPGEEDNCVLSGHRDTVFARLGELKIGNQLLVQTSAGIFTYEVSGIRIVAKDDKTVIVPTDHAVLTLTTCYPFSYIGSAPDRYIVSADLVTSE